MCTDSYLRLRTECFSTSVWQGGVLILEKSDMIIVKCPDLSRSVIISDGVLHNSDSQKHSLRPVYCLVRKELPNPREACRQEGRGHRITDEKCVGYSCTRQEGGTPTQGGSPGRREEGHSRFPLHQAGVML